jgi:hypothetical protein
MSVQAKAQDLIKNQKQNKVKSSCSIAQVVELFPSKREALSSNARLQNQASKQTNNQTIDNSKITPGNLPDGT